MNVLLILRCMCCENARFFLFFFFFFFCIKDERTNHARFDEYNYQDKDLSDNLCCKLNSLTANIVYM